MTYKQLVKLLGPSTEIQRAMGYSKQRVYLWRKSGKVPPLVAYEVRDYMARRQGSVRR